MPAPLQGPPQAPNQPTTSMQGYGQASPAPPVHGSMGVNTMQPQAHPQAPMQPSVAARATSQAPSAPLMHSPMAASTIRPQAPPQAHQHSIGSGPGSSRASSTASTPNLPATSTNQPLAASTHHTATARTPGETHTQMILRIHNIDIDDRSHYADGNASIPQDVQDDVDHIREFRTNSRGYPIRASLKDMHKHFLKCRGKLRMESDLWAWYGDTRLFTRQEWYYFATDGVGQQVP